MVLQMEVSAAEVQAHMLRHLTDIFEWKLVRVD